MNSDVSLRSLPLNKGSTKLEQVDLRQREKDAERFDKWSEIADGGSKPSHAKNLTSI
jgi:hypothetical protein